MPQTCTALHAHFFHTLLHFTHWLHHLHHERIHDAGFFFVKEHETEFTRPPLKTINTLLTLYPPLISFLNNEILCVALVTRIDSWVVSVLPCPTQFVYRQGCYKFLYCIPYRMSTSGFFMGDTGTTVITFLSVVLWWGKYFVSLVRDT